MDDLLDRLRALTRQREYAAAIRLCDEALASSERDDRARLWRLRAYVHQQMQNYEMAAADVSTGLSEQAGELSLIFMRASIYVELRRFVEADADLEQLLEIERARGEAFFRDSALLLQAICLRHLERPSEALAICERLPRDVRTWALGRLWTPEELERESRAD